MVFSIFAPSQPLSANRENQQTFHRHGGLWFPYKMSLLFIPGKLHFPDFLYDPWPQKKARVAWEGPHLLVFHISRNRKHNSLTSS